MFLCLFLLIWMTRKKFRVCMMFGKEMGRFLGYRLLDIVLCIVLFFFSYVCLINVAEPVYQRPLFYACHFYFPL